MRFLLAPALALLVACSASQGPAPATPSPQASTVSKPSVCDPSLDDGGLFANAGVEGVFVIRDAATDCIRATDARLADTGFLPHSTFKIPNALIGLETGVLTGADARFVWDGQRHSIEAWNRDHDLESAMRASCVWCFQKVAGEIGELRMREWLDAFDYGNEKVEGRIDRFWLEGSLRITPRQQVDFIRRTLNGELPVSKANVEIVWRMLELERTGDAVWNGKTGLGEQDGRVVGWLVGYVERNGSRYEYATLVLGGDATDDEFNRVMHLRKTITRTLLERMGAL